MSIKTIVTFFLLIVSPATSQIMPAGKSAIENGFASVPGRRVVLDLNPNEPVTSLDQLIRMSQLIVEGTVTSNLPAFNRNAAVPDAIETDSVVLIASTLYSKHETYREILVAQEGGAFGGWEEVVTQDPLVTPGERYILFLAPDHRKVPANTSGIPRYYVIGIWAGRIKLENQRIRFQAAANQTLHENDDADETMFLTKLKDRIGIILQNKLPRLGTR